MPRTDDIQFFHEATLAICGSIDINEALNECLTFLQRYMPADNITLDYLDPAIPGICSVAQAGVPLMPPGTIIQLSESEVGYIESQCCQTTLSHLPDDNPVAKRVAIQMGITSDFSSAVLHLMTKNQRLGVVAVSALQKGQFTEEHARLLSLLHDPFAVAMSNTLRYQEVLRLQEMLKDDNRFLTSELHRMSGDTIIGENFGLQDVMEKVRQVAPLNSQVLLLGETGAGKEVIANALHYRSPRASGPFIKVNCGAIPESLLDSELFGHEKGAFTGALSRKRGRFERAHGGTLFLDEIGELPHAAQVRLLRVLQTQTFERVGGSEQIQVDVRIITATHRDLGAMVREHTFREDLWFRLSVFPVTIPPLRERKADIPALVNHFIEKKSHEMKLPYCPVPAPGALERLQGHHWPGNVRELENAVERELIRNYSGSRNTPLYFSDMTTPGPTTETNNRFQTDDPTLLETVITRHLIHVLNRAKGKIQGENGAAALLGLHPSTLRHQLRRLGIPFGRDTSRQG
ncbi:sigma 54-interacting transcriptional regulator [Desulfoluna sp.]|uniref:sigma-54 interaction domain-containing protein n=1 Tax=Desulfoluna sp. TaxID=2045199 RepID=UPI002601842A|nr:sigma 54-interacting transcriptional regulator [Desulfoluna sp.]